MALTDAERSALEAKYTARRIVELQLAPVRGNFDAAIFAKSTAASSRICLATG